MEPNEESASPPAPVDTLDRLIAAWLWAREWEEVAVAAMLDLTHD